MMSPFSLIFALRCLSDFSLRYDTPLPHIRRASAALIRYAAFVTLTLLRAMFTMPLFRFFAFFAAAADAIDDAHALRCYVAPYFHMPLPAAAAFFFITFACR